ALSDDEQSDIEDMLWAKFSEDQKKSIKDGEFEGVIDEVLATFSKSGIWGRLTTKQPPKPPARLGPGGAPKPPKKEDKPKSWEEAGNEAWTKFQEAKSGG
ncbi:MAG TPA: hypothetical protein VN604_06415, partial [Nitrospirota bacterium]|nr:hypothetical protein [Nitrospirota bacterium]